MRPCRLGSHKLTEYLQLIKDRNFPMDKLADTTQLSDELGQVMALTSICGLGQVASAPIRSLLRFFPSDVKKHLEGK